MIMSQGFTTLTFVIIYCNNRLVLYLPFFKYYLSINNNELYVNFIIIIQTITIYVRIIKILVSLTTNHYQGNLVNIGRLDVL